MGVFWVDLEPYRFPSSTSPSTTRAAPRRLRSSSAFYVLTSGLPPR